MLPFDEARARLLALARPLQSERVALADAAWRVLAEDAVAPANVPAFDASTMDGYAVRAAEVVGGKAMPVVGESRTGEVPPPLREGTAMRIFTGAPVPAGADTVIPQEEATRDGEDVTFVAAAHPRACVRHAGDDLRKGDVALRRGTRLGPGALSVLASLDATSALVGGAPRVTVLATGSELRDPGGPGEPGTIPESNTIAIAAIARRAGAIVEVRRPAKDDADTTREAVASALEGCDVLVTIGGVSVGVHDHVRPALEANGVTLDFWRVAIKPGKPLAVGTRGETVTLGLPGNPASAMVTFSLFGVPVLRALQGDARPLPSVLRARLADGVTRTPGRLEFARATLVREGDDWQAKLSPHQASGSALGIARADAFALLPADAASLPSGAVVDVIPFTELGL